MKLNQLLLFMCLFVGSSLAQSMKNEVDRENDEIMSTGNQANLTIHFSEQILPAFEELMQQISMHHDDFNVFLRGNFNVSLHEQILPSFGELIQFLEMNKNGFNRIEPFEKNNQEDNNQPRFIIDSVDERAREEQKRCTCECEGCSESFKNARLLYEHCRDKHIVKKEGIFYCTWKNCGCNLKSNQSNREEGIPYTTKKKGSLECHFLYHCRYKRFKCNVCVPVFDSYGKKAVKKHIQTFHREKLKNVGLTLEMREKHTNAKVVDIESMIIYDN